MKKWGLIYLKECQLRLRQPGFWLVALLGPVVAVLLFSLPAYFKNQPTQRRVITVLDQSLLLNFEKGNQRYRFRYLPPTRFSPQEAYDYHLKKGDYAFLHVPESTGGDPDFVARNTRLIRRGALAAGVATYVETQLEKYIQQEKLKALGVPPEQLAQVATRVNLKVLNTETGRISQGDRAQRIGLGFGLAGLLALFVFIFAQQAQRSLGREQQHKLAEITALAVRPYQLFTGKLLSILSLAGGQFVLWLGIGWLSYEGLQSLLSPEADFARESLRWLGHADLGLLGLWWGLLTLGSYLLYAGLYLGLNSWLGQAKSSGLFLALVLLTSVGLVYPAVYQPDAGFTTFFSYFPLSSGSVLLGRLPFDVPLPLLLQSTGLLYGSALVGLSLGAWLYQRHFFSTRTAAAPN
jgi:ABC-type Na+ efflux pump permease subunit